MHNVIFRGKRLQGGEWIEGYFYKSDINKRERESGKATLIFTPDCETFIYVPEYHNSFMVDPETVGEWTGLYDKNGTKVFEGDVLAITDKYDHTVKWSVDCKLSAFCANQNGVNYSTYLGEFANGYYSMEVIGNVYDNAELLGE